MGYKRQMDDATKQKISNSLKGRKLTPQHIERISQGITKAWERVPKDPFKTDDNKDKKDVDLIVL